MAARSLSGPKPVPIQDQTPSLCVAEHLRLCAASARPQPDVHRLLDFAVTVPLILMLLPLLAVITLAVALETPGPVLFCQRRTGKDGRIFAMFKFRSMRVMEDGAEIVQAQERDPRVTRVGRFLRVSSLDELPQLFNVLRGEMSLVGPRPHAVAHDEYYGARIGEYVVRQRVRPGMTGWAQVNGARGATPEISDMQARVALDAWYVAHRNLALDLKILARTPLEVLRRRNAC
jgi:lipopolysaccharide/colanic/teichoic acid biosynthesis glycosyltransferase